MPNTIALVLSTMRDEGPYILEWLAYYRAIGVDDFLIYTNDCRDGTDLLLDRLEQNGELTHERTVVLKRGPQKSAYKAALQHQIYQDADWVMPCDVDEFLNIKLGSGMLSDLIEKYQEYDAIPICWRMFTNNGHEDFIDGFTAQALTDAEPDSGRSGSVGHFVKSIFKPHPDIIRIGFHTPFYKEEFEPKVKWGASWVQEKTAKNPRRPIGNLGYDVAQMNHYAVRSIAPFLMKRDRGDGDARQGRLEMEYWDRWCRGGVADSSIHRMLPRVQKEYDRLLSDPIVRHLHEGALEWHKNRFAELIQRDDFKALKAEIKKHPSSGQPAHSDASAQAAPAQAEPAPAAPVQAATPAEPEAAAAPLTMSPETETLAVKAPNRHKNRLKMLGQMPKNGRCSEIGVWNGGFSGPILEVTSPTELVLIDPWDLLTAQPDEEQTHKRHADASYMEDMFNNVSNRYGHLPNVTIKKGFSADILASYPDDYFDWVYIDGNHLYDFVKKDLEISFKKVRKGGIIAGDDFFWKREGRMHVREAVLDVMRDHNMENRPTRIGQQFMITVP